MKDKITVIEGHLTFEMAFSRLKGGECIKCPEWEGYWRKEGPRIIVHLANGETTDTPWLKETIFREDWQVVNVEKDLSFLASMAANSVAIGDGIKDCVKRKGYNNYSDKEGSMENPQAILDKINSGPKEFIKDGPIPTVDLTTDYNIKPPPEGMSRRYVELNNILLEGVSMIHKICNYLPISNKEVSDWSHRAKTKMQEL